MSFFGFGQSAELAIVLDNEETKRCARIRTEDGSYEKHFLFYDGETVSGEVGVKLKKVGQKLEHQGIRIDLIGQIEVYYDRGNQHDFICLSKELAKAGELTQNTKFAFCFHNVNKPFESYVGTNVKLRYFLRVTVLRRLTDLTKELDLIVHTLASYPDSDSNIKMEVGIEDCLHIEFEYNRSRYHLKDVIVGKIYFLLVRIKIKYMEIAILKRESVGNGPNLFHENETIAKYEIMDGAPVKGESIPIRLFLAGYDLTPTMRDVGKRFSVKYFLNLVLVDEEDRRYFKQQEITLWRKADKPVRKPLSEQILHPQPITSSAPTNSNEQPTQDATHNSVQSASKEINAENSAEDDDRRSIGKNLDEGIVDDDYAGEREYSKKADDTPEQTEVQE
ncbi:vacuolar protein sorting-associated protein 26 domain-containing protein [Ditylenchus destructor]|nr:vacuolar protein sorting-associated protein 26 domain-containing protein [Ditylenchus destructor]